MNSLHARRYVGESCFGHIKNYFQTLSVRIKRNRLKGLRPKKQPYFYSDLPSQRWQRLMSFCVFHNSLRRKHIEIFDQPRVTKNCFLFRLFALKLWLMIRDGDFRRCGRRKLVSAEVTFSLLKPLLPISSDKLAHIVCYAALSRLVTCNYETTTRN